MIFAQVSLIEQNAGRDTYVLPGPLVTYAHGGNASFLDVGLEVSAHHFVKVGYTLLDQPGYGAVFQASVGGLPMSGRPDDEPGTHGRLSLGGQLSFGPLGIDAGAFTRFASPTFGSWVGAYGGGYFSLGIVSVGVQVEQPLSRLTPPTLVTVPITIKWPVWVIKGSTSSTRTSS